MTVRKPLIAGNWKMHKTRHELPGFFTSFVELSGINRPGVSEVVDTLFAVPFPLLDEATRLTKPTPIAIAAQNVHQAPQGAFTGEVSVAMLQEIPVSWVVIGHSERRQYFGETDASVAQKVRVALAAGMRVICCVGETLAEREGGKTEDVLRKQVLTVLDELPHLDGLVVAYEPVWAIGTGKTASKEQAQAAHAFIRGLMASHKTHAGAANKTLILYGGSAKASNLAELMQQADIDGALVGGASLDPKEFAEMINIAVNVRQKK